MKKFYLITLFLLASRLVVAQTTYSHDTSGNRIKRLYAPPLPVTLISFLATKQESLALLTWQTSSQTNSDRFDIEKSQNGKNWANIGSVEANGDKASNSQYSFLDKTPFPGENLYQLKMIDKDETFAYSRLQSLNFTSSVVFYPNPVHDRLRVSGSNSGEVFLFSSAGKEVYRSSQIPTEGVSMKDLQSGMYLIKVLNRDGSEVFGKILKE